MHFYLLSFLSLKLTNICSTYKSVFFENRTNSKFGYNCSALLVRSESH
jgi:hypothetical protein